MVVDGENTEPKLFTAKEEQVLLVAWLCLKSGPPDVDINRLVKLGAFNTAKTASNTWGVIKKKLLSMAVAEGEGFGAKADGTTGATKTVDTSKKRTKKDVVDGNAVDGQTPSKKRKSSPKDVAAGSDSALSSVNEDVVAEAPAKKQRKAPVKKVKNEEVDASIDSGLNI